ncbi:hypothetical protein KKF84_10685 [Myxococcota bacterium]|nr:hypothetical protein [Myxococcota bacterium]MBU1535777.1 hypothetical protein [Myxococcota bacterium]
MTTHEERLAAAIARTSARHMSDAKWRKLFLLLEQARIVLPITWWKYLADPREYSKPGLPGADDLTTLGIRDGRFQPAWFREIEYIRVPRQCPDPRADPKHALPPVELPLDRVRAILEAAGRFPLVERDGDLIILAYER